MSQSDGAQANHPLAPRMLALAFLSYNITLACMYPPFGILLTTVEAKLGVTRELNTLGASIVLVCQALAAPIVGWLAARTSVRLLMMLGVGLQFTAYVLLGLSTHIALNFVAYALIGPGLSLTASLLPSTLATRWYNANRGRAIGILTMPILVALMPPVTALLLRNVGLEFTYFTMAAIVALLIPVLLLVVDYPPSTVQQGSGGRSDTSTITTAQVLGNWRFWVLAFGYGVVMMNATVRGAHIVPMIGDWGITPMQAAPLLTVATLTGMGGSVFFGWLADRLGGAGVLALLCVNSGILWALMLFEPDFVVLTGILALMGLHGSAMVSAFSLAMTRLFGAENFSRVYGIGFLMTLPFNALSIPIFGLVYKNTHSYANAVVGLAIILVVGGLLVLTARQPKAA